jgi:hypothetical protein
VYSLFRGKVVKGGVVCLVFGGLPALLGLRGSTGAFVRVLSSFRAKNRPIFLRISLTCFAATPAFRIGNLKRCLFLGHFPELKNIYIYGLKPKTLEL